MTRKEKREAIFKRIPILNETYLDRHISLMILMSYVNALTKEGIFSAESYMITPIGHNVMAVCEEFDWKPTDEDIQLFVEELVNEDDQEQFKYFLTEYRDNREALFENIKKRRDELGL